VHILQLAGRLASPVVALGSRCRSRPAPETVLCYALHFCLPCECWHTVSHTSQYETRQRAAKRSIIVSWQSNVLVQTLGTWPSRGLDDWHPLATHCLCFHVQCLHATENHV
jgi:hypothetical protein